MIGYAAETETVLTRADIDENFANKADWIHQIEEVRHKNGQGWVPRSAAGCRPDMWRKLVKLLDWVCPVETQNFSEGIMTPPYGNLEELSDDRSMEPSVCKSEKLKDEKGRSADFTCVTERGDGYLAKFFLVCKNGHMALQCCSTTRIDACERGKKGSVKRVMTRTGTIG